MMNPFLQSMATEGHNCVWMHPKRLQGRVVPWNILDTLLRPSGIPGKSIVGYYASAFPDTRGQPAKRSSPRSTKTQEGPPGTEAVVPGALAAGYPFLSERAERVREPERPELSRWRRQGSSRGGDPRDESFGRTRAHPRVRLSAHLDKRSNSA